MAKQPNDRLTDISAQDDEFEPRIYTIVSGNKFIKPSLETFYAKTQESHHELGSVCSCNTVEGTYCSCNKVCTCNLVCTCEGYSSCSCVGNTCSCVGYQSRSTGSSSYCSCNQVCSCVPVH